MGDLKDPNSEIPSYLTRDSFERIDSRRFLEDLSLFDTDPTEQAITDRTCRLIKMETLNIEMGSTGPKNLEQCEALLKENDLLIEDPSKAIQITTLRVLKVIPVLNDLYKNYQGVSDTDLQERFNLFLSKYLLSSEDESLRDRLASNDGRIVTLDQIYRENGASVNIQRHITEKEMALLALPYAIHIYKNFRKTASEGM